MRRAGFICFILLLAIVACGSIFSESSNYIWYSEIGVSGADDVSGAGYRSFSSFKRAVGPAGEGQAWHHIVEQNSSNISKFGAETIHNTNNLMKLPHGAGSIHAQISGHYSSIQSFTGGQTVRQWISTKSFDFQFNYGIEKLTEFGWTF